ncbi:MAG: VCBS repeat-containing protein [bacterium]|nr:VCBS repeat-containing protein [bacterium]
MRSRTNQSVFWLLVYIVLFVLLSFFSYKAQGFNSNIDALIEQATGNNGNKGNNGKADESEFWQYTYIEDSASADKAKGADGVSFRKEKDEEGNVAAYYSATSWQDSGGVIRFCRLDLSQSEYVYDFWPCVTVGQNKNAEFALLAKIVSDDIFGVISSGRDGIIFHVVWSTEDYLNPNRWEAYTIYASVADGMKQEWNDAAFVDLDGDGDRDIVAGGDKDSGDPGKGIFGWFESTGDPLDGDAWVFHMISPKEETGWEMGVHPRDMDWDGDIDIIVPDRGVHAEAGVVWFENLGAGNNTGYWPRHYIVGRKEVRMIGFGDANGDRTQDIVIAGKKPAEVIIALRINKPTLHWDIVTIPVGQYGGFPKDAALADVDNDGRKDIVVTTVDLQNKGEGIYYLTQKSDLHGEWEFHSIHTNGAKYDNITMRDLDGDGDMDIITTVEIPNMGVIIYWNPTIENNIPNARFVAEPKGEEETDISDALSSDNPED